jgi:hypothetical protein
MGASSQRVGEIEAARRFFEPSNGMETNMSRAALSASPDGPAEPLKQHTVIVKLSENTNRKLIRSPSMIGQTTWERHANNCWLLGATT